MSSYVSLQFLMSKAMKKLFKENILLYIYNGLQSKPLSISLFVFIALIALSIVFDFSKNPLIREFSSIAFIGFGGISTVMGLSLILGMRNEKHIRFPIYLLASVVWIAIGLWGFCQGISRTLFLWLLAVLCG